jgi:hypothetical protein
VRNTGAQMGLDWIKKKFRYRSFDASPAFGQYVSAPPSRQNAIDAIAGWRTSFPPQYKLRAGSFAAYEDPDLKWAIECFGPLAGRHVLELGPLDGAHTSMLEAAGAKVDAIEANKVAFLRCLIAREIFGLTQSKFWLGDYPSALANTTRDYDFVVMSDATHFRSEAFQLIELAAKRAGAIFFQARLARERAFASDTPLDVRLAEADDRQLSDISVSHYPKMDASRHKSDMLLLSGNDLVEATRLSGFRDIRMRSDSSDRLFPESFAIFAWK